MSYIKQLAPVLFGSIEQRLDSLRKFIDNELYNVEITLRKPEVRGVQFETLSALPAKYKDGDLYYFANGVAGGAAGLYVRDGTNWRRL
jgi:hypothetical protein